MCGILGWMTTKKSNISAQSFAKGCKILFTLSESRGKEASGMCSVTDDAIAVIKAPVRARKLISSDAYIQCMRDVLKRKKRLVMGHARMVTNGDAGNPSNNQPVVRNDLICIHNGIIVNSEDIWNRHKDMERSSEVDTEIFLALMEKNNYQHNMLKAFFQSYKEIEGSLSIALLDRTSDWLFLFTNVGSLYVAQSKDQSDVIFASERYMLEQFILKMNGKTQYRVKHLDPGEGLIINMETSKIKKINFSNVDLELTAEGIERRLNVKSLSEKESLKIKHVVRNSESIKSELANLMYVDIEKIHNMRRCTKCLLPETFPGINFDNEGVCSICNNYKKINPKGKSLFKQKLLENRSIGSRYDCIVPISGGRDSCYILHYLVKELNLRPVAYTYDWGLVTDLARRNIQRMCSALGVEHILISADIVRKRENVRKNVEAWLRHPTLGTVPLFMAGDKQFFYYAQLLKRQMHVDNVIFGMNALEETQFKAKFIGLENNDNNNLYYNFSGRNKVDLFAGYGREFIKNPLYINGSLIDSFAGYLSYYILPQRYLRFFDFIPWNQKEIENILLNNYNWEKAKDMEETWRIGDGTAPFYNYIYYRIAGFTEFDTFKSNQIREKMITREEAIASIDQSNKISVEGFLWYCNTIGIDPIRTVKIINQQKNLYGS